MASDVRNPGLSRRCSALILVLAMSSTAALAGEGFGKMFKKTAKLNRVHPPEVFIHGSTIGVRVSSQQNSYSSAAERVKSQLESEIVGNDPRLGVEAKNPETAIDITILKMDYDEQTESRRMVERRPSGKDSKGRTTYSEHKVNVPFTIVRHTFSASYKVLETRSGRSLLADTYDRSFQQDYQEGRGAPAKSQLDDEAVLGLVGGIAHRLTSTKETVGVLLPRGSLESAAAFAEAGLWSKYLDALEKLPAHSNPVNESYRNYARGVAYEALGYGAEDVDTTLKYLEQASVHYNNAVDSNPGEGYFTKPYESVVFKGKANAPLDRVQSALVQYQRLKEFSSAASLRGSGSSGGSKGELAGDVLTNASVIDMVRAGLPDDVILTAIDTAPSTAFDVAPKGLIQLSDGKVSKRLIQHIQAVATKKPSTRKAEGQKPKTPSKQPPKSVTKP